MSTSATLTAFRLKSFNYRTAVEISIHTKFVKNADHLGIVRNREMKPKNLPANILKIWSTADLKLNNFIVFKMIGVL